MFYVSKQQVNKPSRTCKEYNASNEQQGNKMGGFAGGDEAGYWEENTFQDTQNMDRDKDVFHLKKEHDQLSIRAHARIDVFVKLTGVQEEKLNLLCRSVRADNIYDTISFVPSVCECFTIEGCDEIPIHENSITHAYKALIDFTDDSDIEEFFKEHKVVVKKNIPKKIGFGSAASDAASFLLLCKEACSLVLTMDELMHIGNSSGMDMAFFLHPHTSSTLLGSGEIVTPFPEAPLQFEYFIPTTDLDDTVILGHIFNQTQDTLACQTFRTFTQLESLKILEQSVDPADLNDFYAAALQVYPKLAQEARPGWFFSGKAFIRVLSQDRA